MKTFKQYLESLDACVLSLIWVGDKTVEQSVTKCHRGDWFLWLAKECGVELQPLTLAKGHCANTVRHLMTDVRSIKAVDVAIAFGEGNATIEQLNEAYAAARAAAYTAAYTYVAAARAAAAAACADASAVSTAYAAFHAATSVAASFDAADNAGIDNLQQNADICRQYLGHLIIKKVNQHLNQDNP